MKPTYLYLFIFCLSCISGSLFAKDIQELQGTIIYNDRCNDQAFPVDNAFDNDINTYFRSCAPFGNWIGMDLEKRHIITKIAYCPRVDSDYRDRLQLGVFQGANSPDFSDAIALFIIPGYTERELTEQEINCSRGFRYLRFVFPYAQVSGKSSYMGELKFYGYEGVGDNSFLPQLTNLPTISIHTVNAEDVTSKEVYLKGIISIVYANGTKFFTDSLEIRGRGNNSWSHPKKPYRIKLANSTRLMGLPAKAKNWTLINNYGDKTLMRNILAFDFSKRLEMPYTSPAEAVDVVLNGDYKGCYQLCDHIDVRKNRVDIEEMSATDLTGGYMIEIDAYAWSEPKMFVSNDYSIPVTIKYPNDDEITQKQEDYIKNHFNKLMSATNGSNYQSPTSGFRKYMDIETFLRHFLVGEYAGNTDTYWSVRMTKDRNDDKFRFGPSWDFDLGFENDHRTYPINDKTDWICFYTGGEVNGQWQNGSSAAGNAREFIKRIFSDKGVQERLTEIYSHYRDQGVITKDILLQVVDSCANILDKSQDLNFKRWQIMNTRVHENPVIYGSYKAEVDNVRNYIANRIEWMDNKIGYVPGPGQDISQAKESTITLYTTKENICLNLSETYDISIFNLSGSIIKKTSLPIGNHTINIAPGAYIIAARAADGYIRTYKCIVA